ncbi:MAG: septum site-determining protein MinC [Vulcanimicrobiaceae bacterium]
MLRGTAAGLEFAFGAAPFAQAWDEMAQRLAERPSFYRGSQATAIFDDAAPDEEAFASFLSAVAAYGIELRGIYGGDELTSFAERFELAYLGAPPRPRVASFERKRAARAVKLSDTARSLQADFAGARADIAERRARGEASVKKPLVGVERSERPSAPPSVRVAPPEPGTLYHRGTLRGGQALQQLGNIVVVGDVNPGAELVASGDILVFGALRGTAHAGAQGDANARVAALELAPTQLRIATFIAIDDGQRRRTEAEVAFVSGDRITIAPFAKVGMNR